jgi:DivIVA domain-containing protein
VIVFLLLIVVLLIGLTTAAVMGRFSGFMAEPTSSHAFAGVPTGSLSEDGIMQVHFDQALRGYRMDQVDEVIEALGARLRELETEVASLAPSPAAEAMAASGQPDSGQPDSGRPESGRQ